MNPPGNDLLLLAGKIITVFMQIAMAIGGLALIIAVGALAFYSDAINAEFISESGNPDAVFPVLALCGVIIIGMAIVAALFVFFGKLREIINTVSQGDPFEPANSGRLNQMAWLMLSVQLLVLPAIPLALQLAAVGEEVGEDIGLSVDGGLDLSGVLMVIILFILARVFRHGAAMRADLEGTV